MAISPISSTGAGSVGAVNPLANPRSLAVEQAQNLSFLGVPPTTVDLSTLGRFLSLASLFQKRTLALQASLDTQSTPDDAVGDIAAVATALAGVFNELQTSPVDSTGLPSSTLGQQSLASQFLQQFGGDPEDAQASLASIGISFELENFTAPAGLLVDETVLRSAFDQDPAATTALLERTGDAFIGLIGTQVQAQAANTDLFADDTESTLPITTLPSPVPVDLSAAPFVPVVDAPAERDSAPLENLVTGNQRNGSQLPDDAADGLSEPVARAILADIPSQIPAVQPALAQFQDPLLTALQEEPVAQAFAAIAAPVPARQPEPALVTNRQPAPPDAGATVAGLAVATAATRPEQVAPAQPPVAVTRPQPAVPQADPTTSQTDQVAQDARALAEQLRAEREAARELDEKIAAASDEVRAALGDELEQRELERLDQQRLDRELEQRRADQRTQALTEAAEPKLVDRPDSRTERVVTTGQVAGTEPMALPASLQPPVPPAPNQALQLARDPAIAAAIAAYNMGTGPFAAQNARPDLQPPKARPVAPVAGVPKVTPADAIGTPRGNTPPTR